MIITNQFTHKVKNKSRHESAPSSICEVSDDSNKSNTDHQRNINGHMTELLSRPELQEIDIDEFKI